MTAQATRRVWFTASLLQDIQNKHVKAVRVAYRQAGQSDVDGELRTALLDLRTWLTSAIASIDDVCGEEKT